jgi:hypothetical protein
MGGAKMCFRHWQLIHGLHRLSAIISIRGLQYLQCLIYQYNIYMNSNSYCAIIPQLAVSTKICRILHELFIRPQSLPIFVSETDLNG